MEILFKTSNFDYETKKICTVCINALFEQYIGKVEGLKYFVICDTEINAFNKTINEFAKYFNSETYAENTEMYQVGAKALHGTDNNGKLCSAVVFKSGIILCLLSDLYGNPSQDKATSECSLQWMGITTVLHEIGHVIDYNTLSKIDPYFISNKIRYDISIPKEKEEYVQRSCINLWSEYFADTYVPVILDIFTMYDEGATIKEIRDHLNGKSVKPKNGKQFTYTMLDRILHNRKYIGEYSFKDVVIPDGIPAIVPKDLFDRVQERLAKNKKAPARKKAEEEYLLTTKLFCGKCQSFMVGESGRSKTQNRQYRYYKCASVKNHKGCDKKTVKKEWIEDLTLEMIRRIICDDRMLDNLADEIINYLGQESSLLPQLRKQLKDCEKGIDNILNAIQIPRYPSAAKATTVCCRVIRDTSAGSFSTTFRV